MSFKFDLLRVGTLVSVLLYYSFDAGAEATFESTGETISGDMTITQDMGMTQGTNLLHSFLTFNVSTGESATFTGDNSITNVIARVSGDSASNINGLLRSSITDANLFLINPNGIAFGENASIDINGSLHLSTANSITFADDSQLLISDSGASGFTAAAPTAFGFSTDSAGISFTGTQISAAGGSQLEGMSATGGDISLMDSSITIAGGNIDLLATGGETAVLLDPALRDHGSISLGDISISNSAFVPGKTDLDTSGEAAGRIDLAGNNVTLTTSAVFSDTQGAGTGGQLNVTAAGALTLSAGSRITTDATGPGTGGDLIINAGVVSLSGTSTALAASTLSQGGPAGEISISADSISITDHAQINSVSSTASDGGDITLATTTLEMASGGQITGQTTSAGAGADVTIIASSSVSIDATGTDAGQESGIYVDSINFLPFVTGGDAGDISITAPALTLTGNAAIAAKAVLPFSGAPGEITLNVDDVTIESGSTISTLTNSGADAGIISIQAVNVALTGAGSGLNSSTGRSGNGGSVLINATDLVVEGGAGINTDASNTGNAGDITLNLSGDFLLSGSTSGLSSQTSAAGQGGTISVSAVNLDLLDYSTVSVTATGEGNAGDISLIASDSLLVLDYAQVQTNAENSGGGNIDVQVVDTIYIRDSTLTASAGGDVTGDDGGNISIDPVFLILDNASIVAQAVAGNGGIIELTSENYIADINSFLDASSELGNDGEVKITWLDNSITGVLGTLSAGYQISTTVLSDACSARNRENQSSLLMHRGSGILTAPGDLTSFHGDDC